MTSATLLVDLSIIIPVFNKKTLTRNMLSSLVKTLPQSLAIEVIIVDDASTDETSVWLAGLSNADLVCPQIKSLRILRNTSNLGYAKSNNLAAKHAKGAVLALLNNDLIFKQNWLEPMLAMFEKHTSKPIIVGNLQYLPHTNILDHAGIEVHFDKKSNRVVIEHIREINCKEPQKVFAITGACCLIKRQTFETLGGFDEGFINGGEDVDLCLKIKQADGASWVVPTSEIWHLVGQTRGRNDERNEKNSWRLFRKWQVQIERELELRFAEVIANSPHEDPLIRRMAADFLAETRTLAPIAVKTMAQKMVKAELIRWESSFNTYA